MFGGNGKRRGFVRTDVSVKERILSCALLLLIAGIGMAVYFKGQYFDTGLFALDQSYLKDMPKARESVKLYEEGYEGAVAGITETAPRSGLFSDLSPEGWQPLGNIEMFTAETLYEKINGRAEQYLAYDVQGMQFVGFSRGDAFIDVFAYDMGQPLNAFGIYSVERTEGAPALPFGRNGYRVEASFFFWKGRYYIQVLGSAAEEALEKAGYAIAQTLADRIEDAGDALWGLAVLPGKDRIPDTVQYFRRDALSLDFLKNAFTARYKNGDAEFTGFIAIQNTAQEAEQALTKYAAYLKNYGQITDQKSSAGAAILIGDMGGLYDVVFQKGETIGGVTMIDDPAIAETMVTRWISDLQAGAGANASEEEQ